MSSSLTPTEAQIVEMIPATSDEIAGEMFNGQRKKIYDHIRNLRSKGWEIDQNSDNQYVVVTAPNETEHTNTVTRQRRTSQDKAAITRKAKQSIKELEEEIKPLRQEVGPAIADGGMVCLDGNSDIVVPLFDIHFGDVVINEDGEEIYNSDMAEEAVWKIVERAIDIADVREELGETIDTLHLLAGGDTVTNVCIYDGQPWEVDATIRGQLNRGTAVFDDVIQRLSSRFPSVQVVCQHGNHGELRMDGASDQANVDDLLYDRLEMLAVKGDYGNVQFAKSDTTNYTNFEMRDGEQIGHLRHGNNVLSHIGTSSPQSDWSAYLNRYNFSVAYRGHYHEHREEPIEGRPVIQSGSPKPGGDYEEAIAAFSRPQSFVHGVTDEFAVTWKEHIYH